MKLPLNRSSMLKLAIVGVAFVVIGFSLAVIFRNHRQNLPAGTEGHHGTGSETAADRTDATRTSPDSAGAPVEGDEEEKVNSIESVQSGPRLPETMVVPVNGVVVAEFGWRRDPVMDYWRFTDGIDISCLPGTEVRAALSGKVVDVERDERGVLAIRLEHAGGIESSYENLRTVWVEEGDEVGQGASVGDVGVGLLSSEGESVVRFLVIDHGNFIDPAQCIGKRF